MKTILSSVTANLSFKVEQDHPFNCQIYQVSMFTSKLLGADTNSITANLTEK